MKISSEKVLKPISKFNIRIDSYIIILVYIF